MTENFHRPLVFNSLLEIRETLAANKLPKNKLERPNFDLFDFILGEWEENANEKKEVFSFFEDKLQNLICTSTYYVYIDIFIEFDRKSYIKQKSEKLTCGFLAFDDRFFWNIWKNFFFWRMLFIKTSWHFFFSPVRLLYKNEKRSFDECIE